MDSAKKSDVSKLRIAGFVALLVVVPLIYAGHLFSLQVVDNYIYANRARQVARRSVTLPAQRGEIYDRNYDVPVATNRDSFALFVNPSNIPPGEEQRILASLAETFNLSMETLQDRVPPDLYDAYREIEVAVGLTYEEIASFAEQASRFPGVTWRSKPIRNYPFGDQMAHLLGFVGRITPEELQVLFNRGYSADSLVGKGGVEQRYDEVLRGVAGRQFRTVDAQGRQIMEGDSIAPENGKTLVLTIDRQIQALVEDALGPRIGSAVVLKPQTGEVLAMASYPRFDPNIFSLDDSAARFSQLSLDSRSPFLNRAIQSSAAPASTFKIVMTAAVINENAFPLDATVNCTGSRRYGNRVFPCWYELGHGPQNIYEAMANSCNIYFYTMASDYLGPEQMIDYSARLGLGQITGVDLPGEVRGILPTPAWKEQTYNTRWVGGDTVNMSIGQGFMLVTPLQMANVVAGIVNDGVVCQPHLVREIRDPVSGEVIERREPTVLRDLNMNPETYREVKRAMRQVITDGTAEVVMTTSSVPIAGKTGTGQTGLGEESLHSWFVAYAPYDGRPEEQVVVAVMVDGRNEWEWWAPKAANIIIHGIFEDLEYDGAVQSLREEPRGLWYM
ncbi:MAG: penicillin-binding protein 2 [Spirochaetaceae bacterium]